MKGSDEHPHSSHPPRKVSSSSTPFSPITSPVKSPLKTPDKSIDNIKSPTVSKPLGLTMMSPPVVTTSPATPSKESIEKGVRVSSPTSTATSTTSSGITPLASLRSLTKLATLAKPPIPTPSAIRGRNARHSIDVRNMPSYLAKKRHSSFGQFLSVFAPSAPEAGSVSSDEPIFEEPVAPTVSLGERMAWVSTAGPEFGEVKWIGRMPQICTDWTVGLEFDNMIGQGDGTFEGRRYFVAKENFAKFLPLSSLTKVDNYAGRPRAGTMLSRMSVSLKPGQLISIQRSPSVHALHCSLNAPHHVGQLHDVHGFNNKHCLCHSCNHPCAHICRTRKPKGRKNEMAHMCHFSSKPHAKMCCGGEDLPGIDQPIQNTGASWMHTTQVSSLKTVITNSPSPGYFYSESDQEDTVRRKSVTYYDEKKQVPEDEPVKTIEGRVIYSPIPDKNDSSAPTKNEEQENSTLSTKNQNAKENERDLSISSMPSSISPGEHHQYIARGALTDESDADESHSNRSSPATSQSPVRYTMKNTMRSIMACLNPSEDATLSPQNSFRRVNGNGVHNHRSHGNGQHSITKLSDKTTKRTKRRTKQHRFSVISNVLPSDVLLDISPYSRRRSEIHHHQIRHRFGLSTDTSMDGDNHCSHCHSSSAMSGASSKIRTSPMQNKYTSTSPTLPSSPKVSTNERSNEKSNERSNERFNDRSYERSNDRSCKSKINEEEFDEETNSVESKDAEKKETKCSNGNCGSSNSSLKGCGKSNQNCNGKENCCEDERGCNGNESTSAMKCNGIVITTRADIESINSLRRHSSPSQQSTTSDCNTSPRRSINIKKGPAPPAPQTDTSPSHTSSKSINNNNDNKSTNMSSSKSLPQSPTKVNKISLNKTNINHGHSRGLSLSPAKKPAPSPPLSLHLTRSLSEQKQLNCKTMINAVPSFRSEIDLQCAARKSHHSSMVDHVDEDHKGRSKDEQQHRTINNKFPVVVGNIDSNSNSNSKTKQVIERPVERIY